MSSLIRLIQNIYETFDEIHLHEPQFLGKEKEYLNEAIESTFVSGTGKFINLFEDKIKKFTGANGVVAVVNGTSGIHAALHCAGVNQNDLVLTQALTFVGTCNAILMTGAQPLFIDVSEETLSLCPDALNSYLQDETYRDVDGNCRHNISEKRISALIVVHTFGHPAHLTQLRNICSQNNITLIEDAAEALGSFYGPTHVGSHGKFGIVSFNGNKIITTGGGGMVLCSSVRDTKYIKHVVTTSKQPHAFEYYHDTTGFNYRLPNLNAAMGCGQIENINLFLKAKRELAEVYRKFFNDSEHEFVSGPKHGTSNYWLNAIICRDQNTREEVLSATHGAKIRTRPVWRLMSNLPMFESCFAGNLKNSEWLECRLINLPSSPPRSFLSPR